MTADKELVKGTLPLLVLSVLAHGDSYGYELIRALQDRSSGALSFAEGTLYPVLHTLERDRLVTAYWDETGGGRRRKYYRVTPAGQADLTRRRAEWVRFADAVTYVVEGS